MARDPSIISSYNGKPINHMNLHEARDALASVNSDLARVRGHKRRDRLYELKEDLTQRIRVYGT